MQSEWNSEFLRLSHFFITVFALGHEDDCTYVGGETRREESFGKKSKHPAANLWQKFSFEYVYTEKKFEGKWC